MRQDVEETGETPENPPVDEQEDEDGEEEDDSSNDNETPVIDPAENPVEEPAEEPVEEEVVDPTTEEEPSDVDTLEANSEINAVVDTDSVISVDFVNDPTTDTASNTAEVVFLGGCVSSDKKLAKDRDLKFRVELAAGRSLVKVEVKSVDGETEAVVSASESEGVYTVSKSSFIKGSGNTATALGGKIIVTTKAVNYKVSFDADEDGEANTSYKIYPVVAKADNDSTKVLDSAVSAATDLAYGASGDFAIEIVDPDTTKLESITLDGTPITVSTTAAEMVEKANAETKHKVYTFSVKPSDCGELKDTTTDNTAATVKVKVVAKAALTVAFDDENVNSNVAASATNVATDKFIGYAGGKFGTDSTFGEGADDLAKSLAFKVTPDANYKIAGVTAKATTDDDADGKTVNVTAGTPAADGSEECTIALNQDALKGFSVDTTLTISIATELDTTKDAVHTITFKNKEGNAPANVTIEHGASDTKLEAGKTSLTVTGNTYQIKVTPDAGYELAKGSTTTGDDKNDDKFIVKIKESRKYAAVAADTDNNKPALAEATKDVTTEVEAYADNAAKALTLNFTGNDKYADTEDARDYTVSSVEVTIDTAVQKNDGEKIVHFTDSLKAGYTITAKDVILDEEAPNGKEKDTYVVPATVDALTFTVTSARVPEVTANSKTYEGTAAENVYTFTIPAMALTTDATTEIVIDAKGTLDNKDVKVKVVADDVTVEVDGSPAMLSGADDAGYYTLASPEEGAEIQLVFTPKPGVIIEKVSYAMGETKKDETPDRKGNVTLTLTVTDDVTVDVVSKSDYRVKLSNANGELKQDGDAYVADYTDTNINIGLTKAGVPYAQNLYDVVVKDGAKTAATEATVSGATATIAKIDETERGKDLTIEVYINKTTKYTTTLKTNAVSDTVTVTRTVNGKDTKVAEDATVEIMPDAEMAFTVAPATGASLSDLDVEILEKDGKALDAATTPIERFTFANGVLTVQTKPTAAKDKEVLVSIFNANATKDNQPDKTSLKGGKFVLKLTDPLVKTAEISKVNAVAGSSTNRAVRLNVSVNFKNKKNLPAAPIQGGLYYKVEFTAPTGAPASVTPIQATTLYREITDYANTSDTIEINLVSAFTEDNLTVTPAVLKDIEEIISTTAKVTLVQSVSSKDLTTGTVADTDYVAGPEAAMKDNTLSTKAPVYETKLSVKNLNGATVITGQENVKVAIPVFSKTTSYDNIDVEFVDSKSGVSYGSSFDTNDDGDDDFIVSVDDDNSILVSISKDVRVNGSSYKTMLKTFGVKVTAAGPDDSYKASAVVKLKVKQGIYSVGVDESKAKLPTTLFKDPSKKNSKASVKITPLLNGGSKDYKPAKSAVAWSIAPASGNNSAYAAAAVTGKTPLVSVKNGTVSVAAGYQVQTEETDNKFTVTIKANDFDGNGKKVYTTRTFEITDQKNEIEKLVVLNADNEVQDPATLTAEDFDYWNHSTNDYTDDTSKYLRVVALKKGTKDAESYTSTDFLPVTFKSGNAKALAVNAASGLLTFSKPADKIKITATTVDGGKASKADLVINVKPYNELGLSIVDIEGHHTGLGQTDIHYSGGSNEYYYLYPHYAVGDGWRGISDYKNLKITVKGGKFFANKNWAKNRGNSMGYAVVVTDKNGKATITITDTANKNKDTNHKDYTITNDSNKVSVKAPSIKLYNPKKVTAATEEITWQVTDKNNDNYAGSYVKLTPDFTVTASNPAYDIVSSKGTILKIDENGRFTLDTDFTYGGAYKMVATVGTMAGGEFVAAAKDVKLNFSIPAKKLKTTLKVKNSYTLDAKGASYAVINVTSDYEYDVSDTMNVIKKVQGKDDHVNRFTEFFETNYISGADVYTIGLKPGLSKEQLDHITSKEGKEDCTGYITVTNYDDYGELNCKDVQVKISFKANKYSLTGATIFSNGTATTPVTATVKLMNGKNRDYIAKVWLDSTNDGRFIDNINNISFDEKTGDMILKSKTAAIEPGKYDVKLIIIPQSSSFVKYDETTKTWIPANDKKENGVALSNEKLVEAAGIPVTAKIEVKAVDTKSIAKVKNLNVTLSTQSCNVIENGDTGAITYYGNGYVQATPTTGGYYQVDVPYSIAIAGSDIAAAADSVKVNLTKKTGETTVDQNTANLPEALVKAAKAVGYDADDNEIPVIRLQVSKKALVALTAMKPADKPITGYGKKLKVPVEIKYTNGITTTDTLNFNITMPKKAPDDFAGVQKLVTDNKAVIEKIQTKMMGSAQSELSSLYVDVYNKVSGLIPADTDVKVIKSLDLKKKDLNDGEAVKQGEETEAADYTGIMDAGKAKVTLTLTDVSKAADNTADVSFDYTLGLKQDNTDLTGAVSAIQSLSGSLTYTNETDAQKLLEEIKKADSVKPYLDARKGHLSLKVSRFTKTPATIKATGTITAQIEVKDIATGRSSIATVGSTGNIAQLSTLSKAKAEVEKLFNTETLVKAYFDNCSGQELVMKDAIKAAAKKAAGNDEITIDFKADTTAKKGWDYLAPTAEVKDADDKVTTAAKDGHLSFILVLTKKQADGSRSMEVKSATATIDGVDAGKYVSLAVAKTNITAEVIGTSNAELEKIVAATANDANAIKTVIATAMDTAVAKCEGYKWAWAQTAEKKDDFTYTPATQSAKGKLSFKIVLTLKGAEAAGLTSGVTETITVSNAEVVKENDDYQTPGELRTAIEGLGTTAKPITAATVPGDAVAAKTALENAIREVNKATTAITVTVENVAAAEGVTATTYTATPSGEGVTPNKGEYKNVKITIGTGADKIEFTHDFVFGVTPTTGG